ncbi:IQ calmodulin-binding motif protein [Niveomyces insectorum RCEF 264]|uniref:IQ calmodulin-binding motif protein n=1 Tax=Niveomyces insectorum RCEF 264 TaxID=1081102 RepID=A0A167YVY7_9HYPO|nr:IQ calmodulin-binding motif protein [Niveomyces insectorum RCEF 264]
MASKDYSILKNRPLGDDIVKLCTSTDSVSALLAADPGLAPGEAWQRLYGHYRRSADRRDTANAKADLERAEKCGKWGPTKPSELFLKIYRDVLAVVESHPDRAMVSPPLLGSCGVAPLTVISTIPDIARHMANVIVRADKEVFLATNYWQDSVASRYLTNALRELSRRAGERGTRVVVKIIYDRGSARQVLSPHYFVSESEYTGPNVRLPAPNEIPHIDLQVVNYHQPLVGTFHSKYMVVDRKIALLQSNNIQDNDNFEMMVHFEGPIVDSFYDMALISWHGKLNPPLPTHNTPAASGGYPSGTPVPRPPTTVQGGDGAEQAPDASPAVGTSSHAPEVRQPGDVTAVSGPRESSDVHRADIVTGPTTTASALHPHPSKVTGGSRGSDGGGGGATTADTVTVAAHSEGDNAKGREPEGKLVPRPNVPNGPDPMTKAFLDSGRQPLPQASIHQPIQPQDQLPQSTAQDPQYDADIAGEVARVQASVLPKPGETQLEAITRLLNHSVNHLKGEALPDPTEGDEMTPYIPCAAHEPFPIAMVNRPPYGPPTHYSVVQPQNAAWLSALRNARKNVFIQTPTLNAEPLIPAIREACERGLDVICYICLGYNDAGELLPRQGGTNEMIAHQLYASLSDNGRKHLHYFWYVAKDQTRPITQSKKQRDCHIKLMIVDETIGIMGNGNQDTQSWYHSQEINVMLESADVCRAWIDGLRRNQNTHLYGELDIKEGNWRDCDGREAEGTLGVDPGPFSWAKGIVGAIERVRGVGGF